MSDGVKIRRLVMFRHGVAYVERGGPVAGSLELSFKHEEMNDVLKSLSVSVAKGSGRVELVAFEAPHDPAEVLAKCNFVLTPTEAGRGVLESLKGRTVEVDVSGRLVVGQLLGLEESQDAHGAIRRQLVLRTDGDMISLVELSAAEVNLRLCEAQSRSNLAFLVDRIRAASAGANRSVRVVLAGEVEDLRVSYVIPVSVWRVSYRLVHEADETLLVAWGIVHNPVDEDIDGIELVLTTGQPVSFVFDLYRAKRVKRTVLEETRQPTVDLRPVEPPAEPQPPAPAARPTKAGLGQRLEPASDPLDAGSGEAPAVAPSPKAAMVDAIVAAAQAAAGGPPRGELFAYRVETPISLKRGGSAMVPLARAKVDAQHCRIWRDRGGANPDMVFRFDNDSSIVLEEGPVVIYENGSYVGEAMMSYCARGAEVQLPFARDMAVRCRRDSSTCREVVGVRIANETVVEEQREKLEHKLRAESDHGSDVEVVFELPKSPGRKRDKSGPEPVEETDAFWRYKVNVPGHGAAQLKVTELRRVRRKIPYQSLSGTQLRRWMEDSHIDSETFGVLAGMLQGWEQAAELDAERAVIDDERKLSFQRQTKISEQLAVLRDAGEEGQLRLRYVGELGDEQDKVRELEDEISRLREAARHLRESAERRLDALKRSSR